MVTQDDFVVTVLGLPADWRWTIRELEPAQSLSTPGPWDELVAGATNKPN